MGCYSARFEGSCYLLSTMFQLEQGKKNALIVAYVLVLAAYGLKGRSFEKCNDPVSLF